MEPSIKLLFVISLLTNGQVVALQTYLAVTRVTTLNNTPLKCTEQLLNKNSSPFFILNANICQALAQVVNYQSQTISIQSCQIYSVTCDQTFPLLSTRVDLESSDKEITPQHLHRVLDVRKLSKSSILAVDYLKVIDFNECNAEEHNCKENSLCKNMIGTYLCVCKKGFVSSSIEKREKTCDMTCGNHTCKNDGKCFVINNKPSCKCSQKYAGPTCEIYKKDIEWVWIAGTSLVIGTLIVVPAVACLYLHITIRINRKGTCNKRHYKLFS